MEQRSRDLQQGHGHERLGDYFKLGGQTRGEGILTRKRTWCRGPEVNRRLAYSSSRGGGEEDDVVMLERKVKAESCKAL